MAMDDLVTGADGLVRCGWVGIDEDYQRYHDQEWGYPLHGDQKLFEKMSLEGFQAGLSWLTILRKRPAFRVAFADFDPQVVAGFGETEVERLMHDASIVRNRAKIEATIANARLVTAMSEGELDELLWSVAEPEPHRPTTISEVPPTTPAATDLSKRLRKRGFRFVGPTTVYALMQSAGIVNDHLVGCWRLDH